MKKADGAQLVLALDLAPVGEPEPVEKIRAAHQAMRNAAYNTAQL